MYAHREEFAQYAAAREALGQLTEGTIPWALPVFVLGEFLRVVTHPNILARPSTREEGLDAVHDLLRSPTVRLLSPGERYWDVLRETITGAGASGDLIHDAEIVAVCKEHGVTTILTEDLDFRRFPGISVRRLEG